jgi:hypothetical protein
VMERRYSMDIIHARWATLKVFSTIASEAG